MRVDVVELVCKEGSDLDGIRRMAGKSIRSGDGVYIEGDRLFVVLAEMKPEGFKAFSARMEARLESLGGTLQHCPPGTDPAADSLYRRAQSMILPVEPRR